jgi:hypothetical protein
MPLLNPDHLFEQAERLLALSGAGAPRQADLRRAISNVYYAVLHAILAAAADAFVKEEDERTFGLAQVHSASGNRVKDGLDVLVRVGNDAQNFPTRRLLVTGLGELSAQLLDRARMALVFTCHLTFAPMRLGQLGGGPRQLCRQRLDLVLQGGRLVGGRSGHR